MNDWFTVEKLDADTFAISEYRHWEETHAYLLCGTEAALLIDTGLGVANIREIVSSLTSLPIHVALTHAHWDHIGGCGYFERIAVHEAERMWLTERFPLPLHAVKMNLLRNTCDLPENFDAECYQIFQGTPERILKDEDQIELGGRTLNVLHTPGHSPGHCCYYEPGRRYLFSGDLIYHGCLDAFYPSTDPMQFYRSVKRVEALPLDRIWPGHHQLMIPTSIVKQIAEAFKKLNQEGKLTHGQGLFDFGMFQIHI